uniref:Anaphase-promoting complex subunit 13 n=1 Tax=Caenorhabditis tropicalis TaxID=1561998 RepID=A0A1I7T6B2_9PELO
MSQKLTRKELKTLKNTLGKQGITMEEHAQAQNLPRPLEVLQVDCFSFEPAEPHPHGWYVGFGVEYNGVGISEGGPASSTSSEADEIPAENREFDDDESSGFDSDPPSSEEEAGGDELMNRRSSDDSDKGQLLYGVDEQFYVDKSLTARNVTVHDADMTRTFVTNDLVTTNRFEVAKTSEPDDEIHHGYQMISDDAAPCVISHSDDLDDPPAENTSSGLWCNFVVSLKDLKTPEKPQKLEIPEEKLKTIPLDSEKLAQISAAMANFQLPTPPGWEGVSDSKILDFVRQRV